MDNVRLPMVKRARDSKIKPPTTAEEKKRQDEMQASAAEDLERAKERERRDNARIAREQGGVAAAETDAYGVLSGRAAEIPIVDERGKKKHLDIEDLDKGGRMQRTRRKVVGTKGQR